MSLEQLTLAGVIVSAFFSLIGIAQLIWMFQISSRTGKIDKLEEALNARAGQLIDAKFSTLIAEMQVPIAEFNQGLKGVKERLQRGDEIFDKQQEEAQQLRLDGEKMKLWVRERFATKEAFERLSAAVDQMKSTLDRCETACRVQGNGKHHG